MAKQNTTPFNQDTNLLVIVESPNKVLTLTKIFKDLGYKNCKIMASVGHVTKIKDDAKSYYNTGIYPTQDFKINFVVEPTKKDVVEKLQKAVKAADYVLLMSDEDREGEAISARLKEVLKLAERQYSRITTHEITPSGVKQALTQVRKIDKNLVSAAEARQCVDKLLGYRLSPIAREQIQARSVGRCQSAGLKLIVEKEEEILNFKPEKYFDLYLCFLKNKHEFKAKYMGTIKKEIKRISDLETCTIIKKSCSGKPYYIGSIEKKEQKDNPKPPFTTSTFQQEANKVYGMPIDMAMSCAQKLFEGINVGGDHISLITYIRTDDSSMSPDFAETLAKFVQTRYGKKYYAPVKKGSKANDNTQEAHECLRVVNLNMTPTDLSTYISDKNLLKIYKLIWERTVMSSMAPAIISDTQYNIRNGENLFVMHSREVIFDGYRKVRVDTEDEIKDDEVVRETFIQDEVLKDTKLQEEAKETQPPKRYTEANFIKELDKRGIGRPSTFATIVKTILAEDRGYCKLENKMITPTTKGMDLSHFLDKSFPDLINLHYTCELEENLDKIATGKMKQLDFLNNFYQDLENSAKKVEPAAKICPQCGQPLVKRHGKYGFFWGCSGWKPKNQGCNYIEKIQK